MSFTDLDEFFDPTLKLPIGGKTYVVPSPDAKTGLWAQGMMTAAVQIRAGETPDGLEALVLDDDEERDLYERLLGDAYAEMVADGVKWHKIKHAGTTALWWVVYGKDVAERFWNAGGGQGKARTRKRKKKPKSTANAAPQG